MPNGTRDATGRGLIDARLASGFDLALHRLPDFADAQFGFDGVAAVGHSIEHGRANHITPERATPRLLTALEAMRPLDPLHMPDNLKPMRAVAAARPTVAQVACFGTAFHHTITPVQRGLRCPGRSRLTVCGGTVFTACATNIRPVLRIYRDPVGPAVAGTGAWQGYRCAPWVGRQV